MSTSSQCFVCHETHPFFVNLLQATITTSGSSVFALLEQIIGSSLDPELTPLEFVCHECVDRFNEYDEAFRRAKRVATELMDLYHSPRVAKDQMISVFKEEAHQQEEFEVIPSISMDFVDKSAGSLRDFKTEYLQSEISIELLPTNSDPLEGAVKRKPGRPSQNACKRCFNKFKTPSELAEHDCKPKSKPFICDICGLNYKSKSSLSIHMAGVHSGLNQHNCEVCGKSFSQRGALTRHMPLHTGEKPYQVNHY